MPPSTLQINLDKTYNIVLFKGLFNGEYINKMKGLGGPVTLYRCAGENQPVHWRTSLCIGEPACLHKRTSLQMIGRHMALCTHLG